MPGLVITSNISATEGAQRGLGLSPAVAAYQPGSARVIALCTGQVARHTTLCSKMQERYALSLHADWKLLAHPLHNVWALANEPPPGESANCVYVIVDIDISALRGADDENAAVTEHAPPRPKRAAAEVAARQLGKAPAMVAVVMLVQVRPCGLGRELTVHYGEEYRRDYECGKPVVGKMPNVGATDLNALMRQTGLSAKAALRLIALNGAPLDRAADSICTRLRGELLSKRPRLVSQRDVVGMLPLPTRTIWAGDGTEGEPIRVASVLVEESRRPMPVADCAFVLVVPSDGERVLYLNRGEGAPERGRVSRHLQAIKARTTKAFPGVYAAQHAVQSVLGHIWEEPEIPVTRDSFELVGVSGEGKNATACYVLHMPRSLADPEVERALERAFAENNPVPSAAGYYMGSCAQNPLDISGDGVDAAMATLVARVGLAGTSRAPKACLLRTAAEIERPCTRGVTPFEQRDREQFDSGVSLAEPVRNSVNVEPRVAPFHVALPGTVEGVADLPGAVRAEPQTRNPDVDDGQDAHYRPGTYHPWVDDPSKFIEHLRPGGGCPQHELLARAQRDDPFCCRQVAALERATAPTRSTLRVSGGRVVLQLHTGGGRHAVDAAKRTGKQSVHELYKQRLRLERADAQLLAAFVVQGGVLYHQSEGTDGRPELHIVVPQSQTQAVMLAAHEGMMHQGRERTIGSIRASRLWWPNLRSDVREFVRNCPTCAFNKCRNHQGEMHIPDNGGAPWSCVAVDIVDLETTASGNRKAVVFADRFSRAVCCFPVHGDVDSKDFLNIVSFGLIPAKGRPRVLYSDRGSNLISALCQEYYKAFGIPSVPGTAHHHTTVALCERFNDTLRTMARAAYFDTKCQWDLFLPYLVMFYNAAVNSSTGYSPHFIEHGRHLSLPWQAAESALDMDARANSSVSEFVRNHLVGLHIAHDCVTRNLDAVESRRKQAHDARYNTNVKFSVGDRVLLLLPGRASKMDLPFIGPYRITDGPDEHDRYRLRDLHGRAYPNFHVSKLKLWPEQAHDADGLDEDDVYIVDDVVDRRLSAAGLYEYRVRWRGYSEKWDSWIARSDAATAGMRDLMDECDRTRASEQPTAPSTADSQSKKRGRPKGSTARKTKPAASPSEEAGADTAASTATATADREARAAKRAAARAERHSQA